MKHIKKFESYGDQEVSKVNEEFDFSAVSEIFNNFVQWLQQTHATDPEYGTGTLVANWEVVTGVLGALGLTSPIWYGMIKHNKEEKARLNALIAKKVEENPNRDPKEIAKEVEEEFKGKKF